MNLQDQLVYVKIILHPCQAEIVKALRSGSINIETDTLREIASKIGLKNKSVAQIVKHHLEQLVNYGVIQKIYGKYVYYPETATPMALLESIETEILSFMFATENKMLTKGLRECLQIVKRHQKKIA